jgi:hypothetical protein
LGERVKKRRKKEKERGEERGGVLKRLGREFCDGGRPCGQFGKRNARFFLPMRR